MPEPKTGAPLHPQEAQPAFQRASAVTAQKPPQPSHPASLPQGHFSAAGVTAAPTVPSSSCPPRRCATGHGGHLRLSPIVSGTPRRPRRAPALGLPAVAQEPDSLATDLQERSLFSDLHHRTQERRLLSTCLPGRPWTAGRQARGHRRMTTRTSDSSPRTTALC